VLGGAALDRLVLGGGALDRRGGGCGGPRLSGTAAMLGDVDKILHFSIRLLKSSIFCSADVCMLT